MSQVYKPNSISPGGAILTVQGDTGGGITPDGGGTLFLPGNPDILAAGNLGTHTIQLTNLTKYTPYVVGPLGQARFTTIQAAINQANADGGGTVYIWPGTYNENLTLFVDVNLQGFAGELGSSGIYISTGGECSVIVTGTLSIDTSLALVPSFNTCENIAFKPALGDVVTFISNPALVEVSSLTFKNCTLVGTQAGSFIFNVDGFGELNLENCTIDESVANNVSLITMPGGAPFLNLNATCTSFLVNMVNANALPNNSDSHFYLTDCLYKSMIDVSAAPLAFFGMDARECIFDYTGKASAPLVNFGGTEGYIAIRNSQYLGGTGGFSSSTSVSANSYFNIYNTVITDTYNCENDCKENFYHCTFNTGAAAALLMNSAQTVSLNDCVINSSASPAIQGTGAGTLSLSDASFLSNVKVTTAIVKGSANSATYDSFEATELGQGQTVGAVTADLVTIDLGAVASNYAFDILITAYDTTTPSGAAYSIIGGIRTTGAAGVANNVQDEVVIEEAALAAADIDLLPVLNTAVVRVTGVAGLTINWKTRVNYIRTV